MSTILLENENPKVFSIDRYGNETEASLCDKPHNWLFILKSHLSEKNKENIGIDEIFDHIRNLNDPEHPLTLEQVCMQFSNDFYIFSLM